MSMYWWNLQMKQTIDDVYIGYENMKPKKLLPTQQAHEFDHFLYFGLKLKSFRVNYLQSTQFIRIQAKVQEWSP